jgi:hypothetical protein
MANENIGGISWVVDADTAPAINSIKGMNEQVARAEKSLDRLDSSTDKVAGKIAILDKATAEYVAGLKAAENTISKTGIVLDKYGEVNAEATKHIQGLYRAQMKMTKVAKGVNTAVSVMGRKFGQAGIQAQQFFGQLQGGQGFLVAASAQFADLGIVLGAPLLGAIGGIAFSLANILFPALVSGKTGLETVQKAVENVKAAMTLGADGVIEYTAEMKKLKQISDALTEIKIASLIAQQNEAFKTGIKETIKLMDDARDRFALGQLFKDGSKEAVASFVALNESIEALKLDPTAKSIDGVEKALLGVSRAGINSTKQGRALTEQMGGLIAEYKLGKLSIDALQNALKDTDIVTDKSGKTADKYKQAITSLEYALAIASREAVGMTEEARELNAEFEAKRMLGGDATKAQIKEVAKLLMDVANAKDKVSERNKIEAGVISIADKRGDPIAALENQKGKELEILQKAEEAGLKLHTDYATLRKNIDNQYAAAESAAREKKFKEESEMNALTLSAIDAMGVASQNMIMGMIDGTMSAKDAMIQLGNTILSEAVGALVQMGIQYVKNAIIEQTADKSSMAAKQATMAAIAAQHTAAVAATVAELTSIGTAAAMSSTAAIPIIGPAAAPAAGAAMGAAIAGVGSAAIASAPVAGMRENGGSVIRGQTYEVGEKNKPELLMIPGNNGKVLSNSEMKGLAGGGGGGYQPPIINNYVAGSGVSVEHRRDELTKRDVFDIVQSEMTNPNSRGRRSMQQNSNLRGVLNGRRRT